MPRICPGLRLRLLKRSRWLISAFERQVHGVNSVFFGLICFGGFFLFCLPAIIDAPTLCSRGSTGFKCEAHQRFVLRSQQDQIQVENSRHLCFPYKPPNKTEALCFTCLKQNHVVPASLMEFEEAQQETGAHGLFMVDWQPWDGSGLLTSRMPVKHLCILKQEKRSSLSYVQRVLQE